MKKLAIVGLVFLILLIAYCNGANAVNYDCGKLRVNETGAWHDGGSSHTRWDYIKTLILHILKPTETPENTIKSREERGGSKDKSRICTKDGSASCTVDTNEKTYRSEASEDYMNSPQLDATSDKSTHQRVAENTNNTLTLRECIMNTEPDYWRPKDPTSYIIPENEWVKYYASQLYISPDGKIRYKDQKVAAYVDRDGTVLAWNDKLFKGEYVSDSVQFKDKSLQQPGKIDYYTNPDYYLFNGRRGDCEDYATAVCSMLLSGEVSILDRENRFVKEVIPAKVVMGWCGNERHAWVEYIAYDTLFACDCGVIARTGKSITRYATKDEMYKYWDFKPVYEYNNLLFREYTGWSRECSQVR
ncbi:MAG: transglutaminase-like domain-containing protein [Methanosarcinales archaeon]